MYLREMLCTGCGACSHICPVSAIKLVQNIRGFYVPQIDKNKCTQCGLCQKKCPQLNPLKLFKQQKNAFIIAASDEVRKESSSGGVFSILAQYFLENGGYVCGASFCEDFKSVKHIIIDNKKDLTKLKKSKYLQSYLGDVYIKIKTLLDNDKNVLFSGTPCQVAGLKTFLQKDYTNLLSIDILCHGVPSPYIWKKYIEHITENNNITAVDFRDKNYEWSTTSIINIQSKNSNFKENSQENLYYRCFLENLGLNESCYSCKYAQIERVGDITLGDFWGIDKYNKKLNDKKGLSLVIINNNKALQVLNNIKSDFKFIKSIPMRYAIKRNPIFKGAFKKHPMTRLFWHNLDKKNIIQNIKSCLHYNYDGIITNLWSSKNNYGAVLSAYAVQEFLKDNGYFFHTLNFKRFSETSPHFDNFINEYLNLTHPVENDIDFEELNLYTNTFIVGTDQVFRYEYTKTFLDKYLLAYTDFSKKRIAFSASFGTDKYNEVNETKKELIKKYFKRFDKISVREDSGVNICHSLGVDAEHIIDPILLVDKSLWENLASTSKCDFKDKIVTYILDDNKICKRKCAEISKKYNKNIINIFDKKYTPEDFVSAIKNCEYFITDSFHGVCLALLFNKKVICLINKERGSSRFQSLINKFNISQIFIEDINSLSIENCFNKYDSIKNILDAERIKAKEFLHNSIENEKVIEKENIINELDILNNQGIDLNYVKQEIKNTWIENLFSAKNLYSNGHKIKIITILGIKIKIKK